jgi:hypothetical protein
MENKVEDSYEGFVEWLRHAHGEEFLRVFMVEFNESGLTFCDLNRASISKLYRDCLREYHKEHIENVHKAANVCCSGWTANELLKWKMSHYDFYFDKVKTYYGDEIVDKLKDALKWVIWAGRTNKNSCEYSNNSGELSLKYLDQVLNKVISDYIGFILPINFNEFTYDEFIVWLGGTYGICTKFMDYRLRWEEADNSEKRANLIYSIIAEIHKEIDDAMIEFRTKENEKEKEKQKEKQKEKHKYQDFIYFELPENYPDFIFDDFVKWLNDKYMVSMTLEEVEKYKVKWEEADTFEKRSKFMYDSVVEIVGEIIEE